MAGSLPAGVPAKHQSVSARGPVRLVIRALNSIYLCYMFTFNLLYRLVA